MSCVEKKFIPAYKNARCCCLKCQRAFADKKQREKRNENPVYREYSRAYKRNYARLSKNKSQENINCFHEWMSMAIRERELALHQYHNAFTDDEKELIVQAFASKIIQFEVPK